MTEKEIIQILTLGQPRAPKSCGVGDDGARLRDGSIITQDTMVEGIHFNERISAEDLGWKIVAVNVSDIAAMGHFPSWCTLSLSVPKTITEDWIRDFSSGLRQALRKWDISLIGGDTTRSKNDIVVSMAMGSRASSKVVWQSKAEIGDDIWVTGDLGDAAHAFFNTDAQYSIDKLRRPVPPAGFASHMASFQLIHSMTDISDGLKADLTTLCNASELGAIIEPNTLPKGSELYNHPDALAYQTMFGEDYQLLFTASPNMGDIIRKIAAQYKIVVTKIGKTIPDASRIELRDTPWPEPLFSHF